MANKKISDLTTIPSVDAAVDVLEISDISAGTSNKVTRNSLLGILGSPVGNTDSQTLSNKILGITNTITLKDTLFTIQDDGDITKQGQFNLSANTTGTTRIYTLPNATGTLVDLASPQTLVNKTLTSPTINGGAIDNSTVTVDAISGHTTANTGAIYGIGVTSSKLSGASITNATIPATALSTDSTWAWQTWSPTLANLTLGNGTVTAKYIQIGKTIDFVFKFVLGSTSAVGTGPTFTLPTTPLSTTYANVSATPTGDALGDAQFTDSGNTSVPGVVTLAGAATAGLYCFNSSATNDVYSGITATNPLTFGTSDFIRAWGRYETT